MSYDSAPRLPLRYRDSPILCRSRRYPGQWVVIYLGRVRGVYATPSIAKGHWPGATIDLTYRPAE